MRSVQYTIQDFVDGSIVVDARKEEVKSFLQMCEETDLRWAGGEKPTEYDPYVYSGELCSFYHRNILGRVKPGITFSCRPETEDHDSTDIHVLFRDLCQSVRDDDINDLSIKEILKI